MEDVLEVGPAGPRWRPPPWWPPRWMVVALALLAAGLVAAVVNGAGDDRGAPTTANPTITAAPSVVQLGCDVPSSSTSDWSDLAAITLTDVEPGTTLSQRDPTAQEGPWSVIVHRVDGSLGRHGAVVTYPVEAVGGGTPVDIDGAAGLQTDTQVVWPVGDAFARVRGDLDVDILAQIARATSVVDDRPAVARLYGFQSSPPVPYRPPEVHEIRYADAPLGAAGARLGFVYTGVLRGAALEDQLLVGSVIPAGQVHGQAAVATADLGGSGMLAWAPSPGVVAYVGYSGGNLGRAEIQALTCLARSAKPLSDAEWERTEPFEQVDSFR